MIQKEDAATVTFLQQIAAGQWVSGSLKEYTSLIERIRNLKARLENGQIGVRAFLEGYKDVVFLIIFFF